MSEALNYPTVQSPVNHTTPVRGRLLSRSPSSHHERAFRGADFYCGRAHLVKPTLMQSAFLAHSTPTAIWWAVHREAYRAEILAGLLPLTPPRVRPLRAPFNIFTSCTEPALPPIDTAIDDAELVAIARLVGIDRMLTAAAVVEAAQ
jgi:hypothetical protein